MPYDGALIAGGISILTLAVSRFKCIVKKNGSLNWGCACMDKPLIQDEDEILVKQFDLGNVKGLYVVPKHVLHEHQNENTDSA